MSSKATHCKDRGKGASRVVTCYRQSSNGPCLVVFVDEFAGYLPAKDLAENSVPHLCLDPCTARTTQLAALRARAVSVNALNGTDVRGSMETLNVINHKTTAGRFGRRCNRHGYT